MRSTIFNSRPGGYFKLMPQDLGYSQAKVLKNGLKSRAFGLGGVRRSGWRASLFCVFDAADSGAIGAKLYYHAKVGSFRDSIRVLRESIGGSVIVWSFACLQKNAVEIRNFSKIFDCFSDFKNGILVQVGVMEFNVKTEY